MSFKNKLRIIFDSKSNKFKNIETQQKAKYFHKRCVLAQLVGRAVVEIQDAGLNL